MSVSCIAFLLLQALACCMCEVPPAQYNLFFNLPLPSGTHSVTMGQMLVLDCEAGGSPAPTIHWLHNGRRLLQGDEGRSKNFVTWNGDVENGASMDMAETLHLGSTRSRFFIDCVTPRDEGKYTCVAAANGHTITSSVTLRTERSGRDQDMPFACLMQKRNHVPATPARVYMWTAQRLEFEGLDIQLFCRGDGIPAPKITWYDQEGNEIGNGKQYRKLENGDLMIRHVSFLENMGVYSCVAENPYGKDVVETFVYPTSP